MDPIKIKVHGGIGDQIWIYQKLSNLDRPLHVVVASEHKHRPRRTGGFLSHLPKVASWEYDDSSFVPTGDWTDASHPACMFGKKWSDIELTDEPLLIECNKWLEAGNRLEDWLPDLPTTHHFEFKPAETPKLKTPEPYVIFHVCSWGDIPDVVWIKAIKAACSICAVYLVGGSYDGRLSQIAKQVQKAKLPVTVLSDLSWPDLFHLISNSLYCFGHASGFTILCDVLKKPNVIINPASLPKLVGTWNSREYEHGLYVGNVADWYSGVETALYALKSDPTLGKWSGTGNIVNFISITCGVRKPSTVLIKTDKSDFVSSAIRTVLAKGSVKSVVVIGNQDVCGVVRSYVRNNGKRVTVNVFPSGSNPPAFVTYDLSIVDGDAKVDFTKTVAQSGVLLLGSKLPTTDKFTSIDGIPNWFLYSKER